MALTGRLHPLLVHFPIALLLIAALAEVVSLAARSPGWHLVAIANVRAGSAFAVASAAAGWLLASSRMVEVSPTLDSHRWLGLIATVAAIATALSTIGVDEKPGRRRWYRIVLLWTAVLIVAAGHFGAVLVWGADFLRP